MSLFLRELETSSWVASEWVSNCWLLIGERKLAEVKKEKELWYGKVLPNTNYHIGPDESLSKCMKRAEAFIREREGA